MISLKEFADMLNNRDIAETGYNPLTKEEVELAKEEGFVVIYGYSDDNMEFDGAIYDEIGCWDGGVVYLTEDGKLYSSLPPEEKKDAAPIYARWYEETRTIDDDFPKVFPWTYETKIPHEEFILFDNGDPWCAGIVFQVESLATHVIIPKEDTVLFAKVKEDAIIPSKEVENAGYDIYACFAGDYMIIPPHHTSLVPTGIACALHPKWYFQVEERGSTGSKGIKKSAGVIDSGYRGEIFIAVTNTNSKNFIITKDICSDSYLDDIPIEYRECGVITYPYKKAIAQLILHEVPNMKTREISYQDLLRIPSKRMKGALGSSGA